MSFDIRVLTIFPEYLAPLRQSLLGKAIERGLVSVGVHDLRQWTDDVHRTVDDAREDFPTVLGALADVGLGHLTLGRPTSTWSGGPTTSSNSAPGSAGTAGES